MSRPRKNDALALLEGILAKPVMAKLTAMAGNGHGPLPRLLGRVIELGLERLAEEGHTPNGDAVPEGLAPRQLAVLDCLRNGYAVGEIAANLGISETTVRTHIARLKDRLECHDLLELRLPARNHLETAD